MSKWCCICDKRGHNTAECWYKKNFLKEINREGGKWKKKYTLPISSTPNKGNEYRKKNRTPTPPRRPHLQDIPVQSSKPTNSKNQGNKTPPRNKNTTKGEVEVIELIKQPTYNPTTSTSTCKECLKWDMRMQHTLKYQEVTKNDNNKIIKSLTETNMKLTQERDCYKRLYELNKK